MKKDCSNILVYKEERKRMCIKQACINCDLKYDTCNKVSELKSEHIQIVQKWSDEHPVKTRQSELLKMFPNLKYEDYIGFCPADFDLTMACVQYKDCDACQKEFWLQEVE